MECDWQIPQELAVCLMKKIPIRRLSNKHYDCIRLDHKQTLNFPSNFHRNLSNKARYTVPQSLTVGQGQCYNLCSRLNYLIYQ